MEQSDGTRNHRGTVDGKLFRDVTELYLDLKSIKQVSRRLGISEVKVRRILLTEGLWRSQASMLVQHYLDQGCSTQEIAEKSGIPYSTLQKLFSGTTATPRHETLATLDHFFCTAVGAYREVQAIKARSGGNSSRVCEDAAAYHCANEKKPGGYTLEDYLALPDDQRVELIDGVFYVMDSPTAPHQLVAGELHRIISNYIRGKKGNCVPFIAPYDVQLDRDDRTIVQPDVFIVCDRSKVLRKRCFGAPDMIIEILSPSTKKKDMVIKAHKYQNAGVREYWMIDLEQERILTYRFDQEELLTIYGFSDSVPVGIYDGDLQIHFQEIADYISWIQG